MHTKETGRSGISAAAGEANATGSSGRHNNRTGLGCKPPAASPRRLRWFDAAPPLDKLLSHGSEHCQGCGRRFGGVESTTVGEDIAGRLLIVGDCCRGYVIKVHALGVAISNLPWREDDTAWFRARPHRRHRCRDPISDELTQSANIAKAIAAVPPEVIERHKVIVCVRLRDDGQRERTAFLLNPNVAVPDNEAAAKRLFEIARGEREP